MGKERKGSSFWTLIEHLWVPATQFLTAVPIVYALGTDGYGIWIYLIGIATLVGAFTPGIAMAATQLISGSNDPNSSSAAVYVVVFGGLIASSLCSFVGGLLFHVILTTLTPLSLTSVVNDARTITVTIIISAILIQWDLIVSAVMRAKLQYREASLIDIAGRTINFIAVVAGATLGLDLVALLFLNAAMISCRAAVKACFCLHNETLPGKKALNEVLPEVARFSLLQWIQNFNSISYIFADRIIIGIFMPPSVVAVAALASQVASKLHSIPRAYLSPLIQELIRINKEEDDLAFHQTLRVAWRRYAAIFSLIFPVLALAGPFAIYFALNTRIHIAEITPIAISYVVGYSIMSLSIIPYFDLVGRGRIGLTGVLNALASSLNAIFSLGLGFLFGVVGVAIAKAAYSIPYIFLMLKKRKPEPRTESANS